MTYRAATIDEFDEIAKLHALSWSKFYRGIFTDEYLDNNLLKDRLAVWKNRAANVDPKRKVIIASQNERIVGFACTYLDHSSGYGSLLDNLHVHEDYQGRGIGLKLLQISYDWVKSKRPDQVIFLTVLSENYKSKAFYYRFGGKFMEEYFEKTPYGAKVSVERIQWDTRPELIK